MKYVGVDCKLFGLTSNIPVNAVVKLALPAMQASTSGRISSIL